MHPYLVHIKTVFIRLLCSNKALVTETELSKNDIQDIDVNGNFPTDAKLTLKCKKAKEELRYIKRLTHWPISELKQGKASPFSVKNSNKEILQSKDKR